VKVGKRARNFEDIHGKEECGILTECSREKKKTRKRRRERNTYYQRNEYVSEEVKKWKD
jgi:hypothetical protein